LVRGEPAVAPAMNGDLPNARQWLVMPGHPGPAPPARAQALIRASMPLPSANGSANGMDCRSLSPDLIRGSSPANDDVEGAPSRGRPGASRSMTFPLSLEGEGFAPRSCASGALRKSHGGKGEGVAYMTSLLPTPPSTRALRSRSGAVAHRKCARVLPLKGGAGKMQPGLSAKINVAAGWRCLQRMAIFRAVEMIVACDVALVFSALC